MAVAFANAAGVTPGGSTALDDAEDRVEENEEVDISAGGGEDGVVGTPPKQGAAYGDDGEGDSVEQDGV